MKESQLDITEHQYICEQANERQNHQAPVTYYKCCCCYRCEPMKTSCCGCPLSNVLLLISGLMIIIGIAQIINLIIPLNFTNAKFYFFLVKYIFLLIAGYFCWNGVYYYTARNLTFSVYCAYMILLLDVLHCMYLAHTILKTDEGLYQQLDKIKKYYGISKEAFKRETRQYYQFKYLLLTYWIVTLFFDVIIIQIYSYIVWSFQCLLSPLMSTELRPQAPSQNYQTELLSPYVVTTSDGQLPYNTPSTAHPSCKISEGTYGAPPTYHNHNSTEHQFHSPILHQYQIRTEQEEARYTLPFSVEESQPIQYSQQRPIHPQQDAFTTGKPDVNHYQV